MRLKPNSDEIIKAVFLPFSMDTQHCTIVFEDKEQGSFCYELQGDVTMPNIFAEQHLIVNNEGPQSQWLTIPFHNHQLEAAKKIFQERHPLARDKDQLALIKPRVTGMTSGMTALPQRDSALPPPPAESVL